MKTLPENTDEGEIAEDEVKEEERRKSQALADRARAVKEEQYRLNREAVRARGMLQESEAEIQQAMNVGREGLLTHLSLSEKDQEAAQAKGAT